MFRIVDSYYSNYCSQMRWRGQAWDLYPDRNLRQKAVLGAVDNWTVTYVSRNCIIDLSRDDSKMPCSSPNTIV